MNIITQHFTLIEPGPVQRFGGFWEWKALFNQKNKVDEKVVRKYLDFLIY